MIGGMAREKFPVLWGPLFAFLLLVCQPFLIIWPWLDDERKWPLSALGGAMMGSVFIMWVVRRTNRR